MSRRPDTLISLDGYPIVEGSNATAPSCRKQLTVWVTRRSAIEFAIRQLNQRHAPWVVRRDDANGKVAVFIPGRTEVE